MKKYFVYVLNYDWPQVHEIEIEVPKTVNMNIATEEVVDNVLKEIGLRRSNCEYLVSNEQLPLIKRTINYELQK